MKFNLTTNNRLNPALKRVCKLVNAKYRGPTLGAQSAKGGHKILCFGWVLSANLSAPLSLADCQPAIANAQVAYVINADNTVTDMLTGLIWRRCSEGYAWSQNLNRCDLDPSTVQEFTWQQALLRADQQGDWRLPNSKELVSLIKRSCIDPAVDTRVFSSTSLGRHWTSTAAVSYYGNAWALNLMDGSLITTDKATKLQVRLVKSPIQ